MNRVTNWNLYYQKPFSATTLTRRISTARLLNNIRSYKTDPCQHIVELGGANSCFIDAVYRNLTPLQYTVVDNNALGLSLLEQRQAQYKGLKVLQNDVLAPKQHLQGDVIFSVGLIEHFDSVGTAQAIRTHFKWARPGGLVVICFPTPTWLYRITRWCAEQLGLWIFHDERPLSFDEVQAEMELHGQFLGRDLIWPIILTQGVLIFRKH
ncbi:MAG: SAM-dependent methyltransferase [Methylobacter sp.]